MEITPEQELLRKQVREFCQKEVKPIAAAVDQEAKFPAETLRKAAALGLFGVPVNPEYDGVGAGYTGYCLVLEEIARACMSHAVIIGAHTSLCALPIQNFGTPEQKEKYLRKLAKGEMLGAFALTEPGAGSDAAAIKMGAAKKGGEWALNGTKIWITNGAEADVTIVLAVNDPVLGARGGVTAFLVDKGTPGFRVGSNFEKMGIRGSSSTELVFENCRVPEANVLGRVGEGFRVATSTLYSGRLTLGAGCLGGSTSATEEAAKYAKERVAFGQPIAKFQAIQFKIADMAVGLHAMRTLVYDLAAKMDAPKGLPREQLERESAIVKLFCSEVSHDIVDEALQVHGGMGYSKEFPVERYYRDQRVVEIFEGTSEIQRLIISEDVLKRGVGH
ncbi:MAG TPA: acyl-CoA dehydrogenase family protein [Thermoplasmata archaeon]|nr:acyl-CoA dehydrogenase family protein [Thermoplasmata archaeon]